MVWFVRAQIRILSPATQAKLNMPSSWHHWNHLPGDSADKCQNQLQRAFPQAARFFSSCWMSRLERPQGVNSHQLHKRSYTTIIIFPPGREASKSTGCNLVLNTKHGQLAGSQQISLKKVRWCAFLRFPRMLSDKHAVTLFDLRWLVVASSSLLHVINANEHMHSHGFSHQSLRRFHSCFVFCIFLHMRSAFCIKPARWYIHLPRPSVLNLNQKAKGLFSVLLRFDLVLFAMEFSYWTNINLWQFVRF